MANAPTQVIATRVRVALLQSAEVLAALTYANGLLSRLGERPVAGSDTTHLQAALATARAETKKLAVLMEQSFSRPSD